MLLEQLVSQLIKVKKRRIGYKKPKLAYNWTFQNFVKVITDIEKNPLMKWNHENAHTVSSNSCYFEIPFLFTNFFIRLVVPTNFFVSFFVQKYLSFLENFLAKVFWLKL